MTDAHYLAKIADALERIALVMEVGRERAPEERRRRIGEELDSYIYAQKLWLMSQGRDTEDTEI